MLIYLIILGLLTIAVVYFVFAWRKMKNAPMVPDNPRIRNLTDKDFVQVTGKGICLVDFWASWCMPCKMMAPVLNDVAAEVGDSASICKVNIEEYPSVARKFAVRNIPTIVILRNGKEVDRIVGVKPKEFLVNKINMLKYK